MSFTRKQNIEEKKHTVNNACDNVFTIFRVHVTLAQVKQANATDDEEEMPEKSETK